MLVTVDPSLKKRGRLTTLRCWEREPGTARITAKGASACSASPLG
jgi:hypothetical protein